MREVKRSAVSLIAASALMLGAVPTWAQTAQGDQDIVVKSDRVKDSGRALDACLARHCPPKEEIEASLVYAESQFLNGDYGGARRTVLNARHRNAKYAKDIPLEVAELMRTSSSLASLNGYTDAARIGAIDALDVLKGSLDADDPRILMQRLGVGDRFAHEGKIASAFGFYDSVLGQARRSGLRYIEAHALLRRAVLLVAIAGALPGRNGDARREIKKLATLKGADLEPFRLAANVLTRSLLPGSDRSSILAAAADATPTAANQDPILLYSRPIDVPDRIGTTATEADTQWANVAFRVAPDGSVRDIRTTARSDGFDNALLKPIYKALASRVYRKVATQRGVWRIERYSVMHDVANAIRTRIRVRALKARIEVTDITAPPAG